MSFGQRPNRLMAAGAMCALHLLLALLWPGEPTGRTDSGPTQAPLVVQLVATPAPRPTAPRERPPAIEIRVPDAPRWLPPALPMSTAPWTDLPRPAQADPWPVTEPARPAGTADGDSPNLPPPLRLDLPPPELRSPGLPRPLAAPRPRSVESRLAQGLASTPLREESMGEGRIRLRQGRRCIDLREARMAQIDPFNQSVNPIPRQAEDCAR